MESISRRGAIAPGAVIEGIALGGSVSRVTDMEFPTCKGELS
jgi:hypothetical protein